MKLLDLFCGAGGAGVGYHRAGFEVTGVDIAPQPNYPFTFIQADALEYLCEHWQEYDVIHASPPCQRYTQLNRIKSIAQFTDSYADLIGITRTLLRFTDKPYIIENVPGARKLMRNPVMLCGSMFKQLRVYRHRLFESNIMLFTPQHLPHNDSTPAANSGVSPKGFTSVCGNGGIRNLPDGWTTLSYVSMAMGIDWMKRREISESIPPAFTEYLGKQMLRAVTFLAV